MCTTENAREATHAKPAVASGGRARAPSSPRTPPEERTRKPLPEPIRVLHMFSGPPNRGGGFAAHIKSMGAQCDELDIFAGDDCDLLDEEIWAAIKTKLVAGYYDAKMCGPSCSTFLECRLGRRQGAKALARPFRAGALRLAGLEHHREK